MFFCWQSFVNVAAVHVYGLGIAGTLVFTVAFDTRPPSLLGYVTFTSSGTVEDMCRDASLQATPTIQEIGHSACNRPILAARSMTKGGSTALLTDLLYSGGIGSNLLLSRIHRDPWGPGPSTDGWVLRMPVLMVSLARFALTRRV